MSTNSECWRGCGEKETLLYCWWKCNLIQPIWKTVWRCLKKIRIKLPYDPIILLDTYPEKTIIDKDRYTERLYFLGSKITADGDCSHEINRHLLLGRKTMTNLDNVLKSRDIILLTKVHIVKAMVFPVVMYRCELAYKEG